MWLDKSENGYCHIGIDDFLAKVISNVDNIDFIEALEPEKPAVILSVNGVDLRMVFPNSLRTTGRNAYLRSVPQKLVSAPYTAGWLYQGKVHPEGHSRNENAVCTGLVHGFAVISWMQNEVHRLSSFIHERITRMQQPGECLVMDGGTFCPGLLQNLNRQETLKLFNDFFSSHISPRSF